MVEAAPGQGHGGGRWPLLFLGSIVGGISYVNWRSNQVVQKQNVGVGLLADADRAKLQEEFVQMEVKLSSYLKEVEGEPKLEPISLQVAAKQRWVVEQLRIRKEQETAEGRDRLEHGRFQRFLTLRQEAQLFAAVTGDQIAPDRLKRLRAFGA